MKLINYLFVIGVTCVAFSSCKKDEDPDPEPVAQTKTQLLTGPNWRLTSVTESINGSTPEETATEADSCALDILLTFTTTQTYEILAGELMCDSAMSGIGDTGIWVFNANQDSLIIDDTNELGLVELSSTTFKFSDTYIDPPNDTIVSVGTYIAQ